MTYNIDLSEIDPNSSHPSNQARIQYSIAERLERLVAVYEETQRQRLDNFIQESRQRAFDSPEDALGVMDIAAARERLMKGIGMENMPTGLEWRKAYEEQVLSDATRQADGEPTTVEEDGSGPGAAPTASLPDD
jgi:hypothetical protein